MLGIMSTECLESAISDAGYCVSTGHPGGTTSDAGYCDSTRCPEGSTEDAGFNVACGRPLGTTYENGALSVSIEDNETKLIEHTQQFDLLDRWNTDNDCLFLENELIERGKTYWSTD